MRYLIIGLGIYGSNLAMDLTEMGHEVIGADRSASIVDSIKDKISTAYILDSTDESALGALPLTGVDLVIVAIGENFGASIKTVALLKKFGVRHIYARAADPLHEAILEGLKIDRILTPEQRAARDLTQEMALGHQAEVLRVGNDIYVMRFGAPEFYYGTPYNKLGLDEFGLSLVGATRPIHSRNVLGIGVDSQEPIDVTDPAMAVTEGDLIICYGPQRAYRRLINHIS